MWGGGALTCVVVRTFCGNWTLVGYGIEKEKRTRLYLNCREKREREKEEEKERIKSRISSSPPTKQKLNHRATPQLSAVNLRMVSAAECGPRTKKASATTYIHGSLVHCHPKNTH